MDFEQLVSQSEAERRGREEREQRQRTIVQQRIQEVKQEMVELRQDIDSCLTEVEACFNLLLPRFDLPDIYSSTDAAGQATTSDSQDISPHQDTRTSRDTRTSQDTVGASTRQGSVNQSQDTDLASTGDTDRKSVVVGIAEDSRPATRRLSSQGSFVSLSEGTGSECEGARDEGDHNSAGGGANTSWVDSQDSLFGEEKGESSNGGRHLRAGTELAPIGGCDGTKSEELGLCADSDSDVEWEDVEPESWDADMQEHGMASHGFSVPVQLSSRVEVMETDDNSSILATLQERRLQLVNHHLPNLSKCLEVRK